MRVFVTGGTGLIGSRLVRRLRERGDHVVLLTRRPDAARPRFSDCTIVEGDPMQAAAWMDSVAECDAVINLAGENIFGRRWNDDFKALLRDSRVKSTENVVRALGKHPRTAAGSAKVLVNASAIGYYGPTSDEELTEDSPAGNDTLARVCIDWEKAARAAEAPRKGRVPLEMPITVRKLSEAIGVPVGTLLFRLRDHGAPEITNINSALDPVMAETMALDSGCELDIKRPPNAEEAHGIRVAMVRVGVVLDNEGGALKQMLSPFKLFVGGKVGSGKQYLSWIHRDDIVGIFLLALDNADARGPINGTASNPVTNKEFSKALGRALHRPSVMPTPAFALRLMLGEVAEIVTTGQRVLPKRALALGYSFQFPQIDAALTNLLA